jgi:dinuclear metal center YbgI/SA1388 family protein
MSPVKTISRDRLVNHLNEYLDVDRIEDAIPNGLQIEGAARISRIAYAVDASVQTARAAVRAGAGMLITHHGLFWEPKARIVGTNYKRIAPLIQNRISLYAVHLPLDCHQEVGNNVELARLLGLDLAGRFAMYKGTEIGTLALPQKPLQRASLRNIIEKKLRSPVEMLPFGPKTIRKVGIISGDAGRYAETAKNEGCDVLVTGETDHTTYHLARDAGVNVIYGGHYATETVGLKALKRYIEKNFGIAGKFVSAPTGY